MFPPEEKSKAEDISTHELNIYTKEQFIPPEKYDLIHIRYLSAAVGPEQWDGAFYNYMSILKPGGRFTWEELLLEKMSINDLAKWANKLEFVSYKKLE
ncbi:uncharacterized protein DFL_001536 [Arthrobotrys flagrans]|uniref:Methyltransferase type 11 domain-containing protein n=1 Tax=Arthrobotrys flagrans TaxID=97331 RepID=A0A437A7W4_ARTFL|nr:hypothetical protein DFL_001536 [Arthrobotrys flagrans]